MSVLAIVAAVLFNIIWFMAFAVSAGNALDRGSFIGCLFYLALACLPMYLGRRWSKGKKAKQAALGKELLAQIGATEQTGHSFVAGKSGIAISPATQKLVLLQGALRKVYPFADVREWESSNQRSGHAIGGNVLATTALNIGAAQAAINGSGFFVKVRDIDHPTWRVEMFLSKDQARWMEILRQAINGD
ncbi:DUF4755 domain-containing protein [Paucibacter sp. R3-3]|uniref:DUF4755 domain-containing protein n=1 Tax=Roseateles agri TaxID=3098619 RepID=A0ABU5DQM8_9BURK|nr:DUF4755 domain-containing protein [Paucibacter sp. R3-3]MDY0747930.1 DUF4755 domain-containing protein [Paucibacter sp. R3-3]